MQPSGIRDAGQWGDIHRISSVWAWLEDHAHEECCDALSRASHVLITTVIQGGATVADTGAERWARASVIPVLTFRAD
ncbi:MAG: DUF2493 domain-containing protein [Methylobacterium organophilum]|nr:DUF2493 domain-containing protein [Methylobacterium organophilum]